MIAQSQAMLDSFACWVLAGHVSVFLSLEAVSKRHKPTFGGHARWTTLGSMDTGAAFVMGPVCEANPWVGWRSLCMRVSQDGPCHESLHHSVMTSGARSFPHEVER